MDPNEPLQPDDVGSEPNPYSASLQPQEQTAEATLAAHAPLPRIWPTFVAVLAAFVGAIGLQIVMGGVLAFRELSRGFSPAELGDRLTQLLAHPALFLAMTGAGQVAFGLAAIIPAALSKTPTKERLGVVPLRQSWTIYPLTMIGSLAPLGVAVGAAHLLAQVLEPDQSVRLLFERMTLGWSVPFVLFIAFAPGFFEEMLFRGYMQRRLLQRWRPWTAITVTSVIFGLMHVMPHAIVVALPLGFWFGVIAWRTGSIGPCIACHAFVNGGLNFWRMVVKFGEVPETAQWIVTGVALVLGLVCFVLACRQLALSSPPEIGEADDGQEESKEVLAQDS
jgi:membrane protease YdiL (CAAX protease family)